MSIQKTSTRSTSYYFNRMHPSQSFHKKISELFPSVIYTNHLLLNYKRFLFFNATYYNSNTYVNSNQKIEIAINNFTKLAPNSSNIVSGFLKDKPLHLIGVIHQEPHGEKLSKELTAYASKKECAFFHEGIVANEPYQTQFITNIMYKFLDCSKKGWNFGLEDKTFNILKDNIFSYLQLHEDFSLSSIVGSFFFNLCAFEEISNTWKEFYLPISQINYGKGENLSSSDIFLESKHELIEEYKNLECV